MADEFTVPSCRTCVDNIVLSTNQENQLKEDDKYFIEEYTEHFEEE